MVILVLLLLTFWKQELCMINAGVDTGITMCYLHWVGQVE